MQTPQICNRWMVLKLKFCSWTHAGHRFAPIQFEDLNFEKSAFDTWKAYGQAKTANILLANEIERRYGSQGSCHLHFKVIDALLLDKIGF